MCDDAPPKNVKFSLLLPPPPPRIRKMDRCPCLRISENNTSEMVIYKMHVYSISSVLTM